ncbi:enoyl-CoA hydratase/carnithine racemase [Bradyrhizobium diazoefficiens]
MSTYTDIGVEKVGHVGTIEIRRPPLNFFDISLINQIADALDEFDRDIEIRASVLSAQGKAFCAGANFGDPARQAQEARAAEKKGDPADNLGPISHLYIQAVRIFRARKPIVAAVQGAAIGGGLGLAVSADFRVTCPEARFSANFTKLGFHPGFGLTVTLPELIGKNNAELMFYTSRRVTGEEAVKWGLANELVPQDQVKSAALKLAGEIAECSPLGLLSTRATMRASLADRVMAAHQPRTRRADPPARDGRFQGRRQGHGRTARGEFQGAVTSSSFSPCGRRWREAPDEGYLSANASLADVRAERTPHPSRRSAASHPLPQGERV